MYFGSALIISAALLAILLAPSAAVESAGSKNVPPVRAIAPIKKAAFTPAAAARNNLPERIAEDHQALVFSAPPRETEEEGVRTYQPIAEYLARIIGKPIVYRHPSDWLTYQTEMQRGSYDLVFDEPHLNGWRIANLQHSTLAKIADEHVFAVVVRRDETRVTGLKQLAGQKVCGMGPPSLGTLAVMSRFDNPARQPLIVNSVGWTKAYAGVAFEKKCAAAILPVANLRKFSNSENFVRVVYQTKPLPNQAFSAGPRIAREDQARIAAALISPGGAAATARLMAANGADKGLTFASKEEYAGLDIYLKDAWGYTR